jgi:hypothetical protein
MKTTLPVFPFMVLLFSLPFPGAVPLRLTCLAAACLIVVISWRRLAPPPFPCKWAIALWAGVVIVMSGSALLGADLRRGQWPSDAYYRGVGSVSNLSGTARTRQNHMHTSALIAGKADALGEDRLCEGDKGKALAAHSTLNRLELGVGGDAWRDCETPSAMPAAAPWRRSRKSVAPSGGALGAGCASLCEPTPAA